MDSGKQKTRFRISAKKWNLKEGLKGKSESWKIQKGRLAPPASSMVDGYSRDSPVHWKKGHPLDLHRSREKGKSQRETDVWKDTAPNRRRTRRPTQHLETWRLGTSPKDETWSCCERHRAREEPGESHRDLQAASGRLATLDRGRPTSPGAAPLRTGCS